MKRPTLRTQRLLLRPFTLEDAPAVQRLAGDPAIASNAIDIPHPFVDGMAEAWIRSHESLYAAELHVNFAIDFEGELVGAVGLRTERDHDRAELGYWIGKPWWGRGLATEAAAAVIRYGFETLALGRIYATHLGHNPASGRVLAKLGLRHEGTLRRHVCHWGRSVDLVYWGRLSDDA